MIWWMIQQVAGFVLTWVAIMLVCSAFDIPIYLSRVFTACQ